MTPQIELYLIRHAAAEELQAGHSDAERRLTARGKKCFRRVVDSMSKRGLRFDRLFHSPLLRAVETAELCRPLLRGESAVCNGLASAPTLALLHELSLQEGEHIALVGHEPWLSQLCALCLTGQSDFARAFLFKKGGVAWLSGLPTPGRMRLRAFIPPKFARA